MKIELRTTLDNWNDLRSISDWVYVNIHPFMLWQLIFPLTQTVWLQPKYKMFHQDWTSVLIWITEVILIGQKSWVKVNISPLVMCLSLYEYFITFVVSVNIQIVSNSVTTSEIQKICIELNLRLTLDDWSDLKSLK